MKRFLLLIACASAIGGCGGEPTIDGSSPEAFEISIMKIGDALSEEKRQEFAMAYGIIMQSHMGDIMRNQQSLKSAAADEIAREILDDLDGLTADQVIAKAKALNE